LQPIEAAGFRNVPILAELTREVTAGGAERQHRRAWQKMVQRLFLDWVDAEARRATIGREQEFVVAARSHEAQPALPVVEPAVSGTEIALDTAVGKPLPITAANAIPSVAEMYCL
jgi:hypothetical protein